MADDLIIKPKIKIKVLGIGGGGNNVIARMGQHRTLDIELVAINTDQHQLGVVAGSGVRTVAIGENLTAGRGTGGNVELGGEAARAAESQLKDLITGADLIFIAATLGGGFGTGAAPVIARLAKEMGVLSIGVVTTPFMFEGARKKKTAQAGIASLQSQMDALIVVENDNLLKLPENRTMSFKQGFVAADNILKQAINCISELILTTGIINVDFADVTTIFRQSDSSDALLAIGQSTRDAVDAVKSALSSPLNERGLAGARGVILNITGDERLSLYDVEAATTYIAEATHPSVNIILGTVVDPNLSGSVRITLIATDFVDSVIKKAPAVKVPESQVKVPEAKEVAPAPEKREADPLSIPVFMSKPAESAKPTSPFAFPAFKLVPDDKTKQ